MKSELILSSRKPLYVQKNFKSGARIFLFGIDLIIMELACALTLSQHVPGAMLSIGSCFGTCLRGPVPIENDRASVKLIYLWELRLWTSYAVLGLYLLLRVNASFIMYSGIFSVQEIPPMLTSSANANELKTWIYQSTWTIIVTFQVYSTIFRLLFYIPYFIGFPVCDDPKIGIADQIKNWIQKSLHKPVIWWPLEPPQRLLLPDTARITRECVRFNCYLVAVSLY